MQRVEFEEAEIIRFWVGGWGRGAEFQTGETM
jgi:hypothetical protein